VISSAGQPEEQPDLKKPRAPVFQGLRFDKKPSECKFEHVASAETEVRKAEAGEPE